MKIVVKIGGAALDNKAVVQKFAGAIADLVQHGHRLVVIHGGGAAISRTLHELGRESQFVNGLRDYWGSYYRLRQVTLFDFVTGQPIR